MSKPFLLLLQLDKEGRGKKRKEGGSEEKERGKKKEKEQNEDRNDAKKIKENE